MERAQGCGQRACGPVWLRNALAAQVLAAASTPEKRAALKRRLQSSAQKVFSMSRYAQAIGDEAEALMRQRA